MTNSYINNLYEIIKRFGDRLLGWIDEGTGVLTDPFETIYGEGYGPGIAAHIFAGLYRRFGEDAYRTAARLCLRRVFDKIQNPTDNSPFTNIFLYYWSLKAYELLARETAPDDCAAWRELFTKHDYDFTPPNTNGHCLLLGTSIMYTMLGFETARLDRMDRLIATIEKQQNSQGFIDDVTRLVRPPIEYYPGDPRLYLLKLDKLRSRLGAGDPAKMDLKPIAYHLFSCAVLAESMLRQKRHTVQDLTPVMERIQRVVNRGCRWIDHFIGADGSFSMTERSRDHFWTGGCHAYLLSLRGGEGSVDQARRHLDWWSAFLKADGTSSITPNNFSNALRVGFENYANMTMYVTQGFSFMLDAAEVLSTNESLPELPGFAVEPEETFVDEEAGYAHIRRGKSSVGISLRRHGGGFYGGYASAMGIFNAVVGGSRLRPLPNPCYRTKGLGVSIPVRIAGIRSHGVYDGIRVMCGRRNWGLDFTTNADVTESTHRLILTKAFNGITVKKEIRLHDNALEVVYRIRTNRFLHAVLVTVPVLLSDGKHDASLQINGSEVAIALGDEKFGLSCTDGYPWIHHQERYLLSTSGITSQLYVEAGKRIGRGDAVTCSLLIERLN